MPVADAEVSDMTKKILSVACLWLILALLVFACTDREAYTWRFGTDELDSILVSPQQAEELQAAIMGNFGKDNDRKSSRAVDPRQLLTDFASAGLVMPDALAEFQRRVEAAKAVIFANAK